MASETAESPTQVLNLARAAQAAGQESLAAGDRVDALRWLDRAHRLLPSDPNMALSLATALLGHDDNRSAMLFEAVLKHYTPREAWAGLATARLRLGQEMDAAQALSQALRRHVPDSGFASIATTIARQTGAPGWCGLTGEGQVVTGLVDDARISLRLDGKPLRSVVLPKRWRSALALEVLADDAPFIGSPIDIRAITRCEGFVDSRDGGLIGWAWHPADPARDPTLTVETAEGHVLLRLQAADHDVVIPDCGPLARPRGFAIPAETLVPHAGPFHVRDAGGRDLMGSPIDPGIETRSAAMAASGIAAMFPSDGPARSGAVQMIVPVLNVDTPRPNQPVGLAPRPRPIGVVIPVYGRLDALTVCLDSVFKTVPPETRIVVVDDASPDPDLIRMLDDLARAERIVLIRHDRNLGFPHSANDGIRACVGHDVVLLNSDTIVPPGWLQRLCDAARAAPDIGTVTPFSNNASLLSVPYPAGENPVPDQDEAARLDRLASKANGTITVDLPVGVGFCLYIRGDCLDAVGLLRADLFAQGYGEENDFCLRARHLGWRHVALPGLYVAHDSGLSFGAIGRHLRARNDALLNRLHPGYAAAIARYGAADPLFTARRRLDRARWIADRRRGGRSAVLVTHADGGGVEQRVKASASAHEQAGRRAIVLRPDIMPSGQDAIAVGDGVRGGYPNLRFAMPDELGDLVTLLRQDRPERLEAHHFLGIHPAIYALVSRLGIPYDVHVHDFAWFCQRVSLVGAYDRYCGEPDVRGCEACVADTGRLTKETIGVQAMLDRSAGFLRSADRVVAPTMDAATRMHRHFPTVRPVVEPHEDDAAIAAPPASRARDGRCVVCVVGSIGIHKGYNVLLACARDAADRDLPLDFILVGTSIDDERLMDTGRIFVTGRYEADEAVSVIRRQNASLALLPSIWPETWCLGLSEIWRAGLRVAAFDMGAPAERIRKTEWGLLLPLGLPPRSMNTALLTAVGLSVRAQV